jgi:Protein kinase domain/PEGA domain
MDSDAKRAFYLGRYNCIERLGIGPLGETFRAKIYGVAGFEKQFAVKRLHARLCVDESFVARFVTAATAYSGLDHERIARVHEVNVQGAQYYLVVDLVRGLDLEHLLETLRGRGEAVTSDGAMLLALDLCEALDHAHARKDLLPGGVLHLGLAPQTVMLTFEGEIKLLDVGLVAPLVKPGWADDDTLVPTLGYLAPEELRGGPVDARADVFSLGAILHELLSGTRAFAGATAAEVRRKVESAPPPPPAADGRLQALLPKAMAVDPDARFPSVAALREALVPILGSRVSRARNELAALVRRLGRPVSRTGSFAAVAIPPSPIVPPPPISVAAPWSPPVSKPPPIPPPIPRAPRLETPPPRNTFAGVGSGDQVIAPIDLAELPGPTTAPAMPAVIDDATTTPMERVEPEVLPPIRDPPPARPVDDEAVLEATPAEADELPPLSAQAAEALAPATPSGREPTRPLPLLIPEGPEEIPTPSLRLVVPEPSPPAKASLFVPPPLAAAAPSRVPRWLTIGLTVAGLATITLVILYSRESGSGKTEEPPPAIAASATTKPVSPSPSTTASIPSTTAPIPSSTAPIPSSTKPSPSSTTPSPSLTPTTPTSPAKTPTSPTETPLPSTGTAVTTKTVAPSSTATSPAAATTASSSIKTTAPAVASGGIEIATTPPGALVYVDGEPRGASPVHVELGAGSHKLTILGDGYKVQHETVRSTPPNDRLDVKLEAATLPSGVSGPAGLKVRCHSSLRILVDGADTGRMCPNDERISVTPGPHKIGLYSPLTDETHELDAEVKDGDHSTRVYTKY